MLHHDLEGFKRLMACVTFYAPGLIGNNVFDSLITVNPCFTMMAVQTYFLSMTASISGDWQTAHL